MAELIKQTFETNKPIGYVVGGGLEANLQVRLIVPPQEVQEGAFVVIDSGTWRFYGLVTDLQLGATDPRFADEQSELRLPAGLAGLLHGQTLFTNLNVMPVLMIDRGPEPGTLGSVSYTHLRAHETVLDLVCRLLLEKKKTQTL